MKLERKEEFTLDQYTQIAIQKLFAICFSGYPSDRIYFKQLPCFRYLCWEDDELIAHMAVDHRIINNENQHLRIFGIVDLCVHPAHQHKRIASKLLRELENLGQLSGIDFLLLTASDAGFYESNGFETVHNSCKWLLTVDHQSLGVIDRTLEDGLMIKPLTSKKWKEGTLDFLGNIF